MRSRTLPEIEDDELGEFLTTPCQGPSIAINICLGSLAVVWMTYGNIGSDLLFNTNRAGYTSNPYWSLMTALKAGSVVFCVATAWLIRPGAGLRTLWRSWFVPLLLVALASAAWSPMQYSTLQSSILLLLLVLAVSAALEVLGSDRVLKAAACLLGISMIVSLAVAIIIPEVGTHSASDYFSVGHEGKWRGIFSNKNALGAYAGSAILFMMAMRDRQNRSIFWSLSIYSSVICLLMSYSVSAVAAAAAGILVWVALRDGRVAAIMLFMAIVFAAALVMFFGLWSDFFGDVLGALGKDETFTGRTDIWAGVLALNGDAMAFGNGYGAGNLFLINPVLTTELMSGAVDAHNGYLDHIVDIGLLGLAALILPVIVSLVRGVRQASIGITESSRAAAALTSVVVGACVLALAEVSSFRPVGYGGWMLYSAILMVAQALRRVGARHSVLVPPGLQPQRL